MLAFLMGSRIARAIGAALIAVLGVLTFGAVKKREGKREARTEDYIKTRKEMDDAEIHGNDPDAARRFLHERQSNRDL